MRIGIESLANILNLQEKKQPLIHCISNSLGTNNLARGINYHFGKAITSNSIEDAAVITSKASCLLISMENINRSIVEVVEKSLRMARIKSIPVILQTREINYSEYRKTTAMQLFNKYKIDVVVTDISEISSLLNLKDKINPSIIDGVHLRSEIRAFAKKNRTIIVMPYDRYYITDGFSEFFIEDKISTFKDLTNINDILVSLISVGVAVGKSKAEFLNGIITAIIQFKNCKATASNRLSEREGAIIFEEYLLDEISQVKAKDNIDIEKIDFEFNRK